MSLLSVFRRILAAPNQEEDRKCTSIILAAPNQEEDWKCTSIFQNIVHCGTETWMPIIDGAATQMLFLRLLLRG